MTGTRAREDVLRDPTASPWAVRMSIRPDASGNRVDPQQMELIGRLRLISGVEVLIEGDAIWLRGSQRNDSLSQSLRSLPDAERYRIGNQNQLTYWDETVPRRELPQGDWRSIRDWLGVVFPTAEFAGSASRQIPLRLVRSTSPEEVNVFRMTWSRWRDYVLGAPQIRLNQWSFAVSDQGEVLIRGLPLPPLPGESLVERAGVAIPAGYVLDPPLDPESVRKLMRVTPDDWLVFREDGEWELVPAAAFVQATRSAVRQTDESLRSNDDMVSSFKA